MAALVDGRALWILIAYGHVSKWSRDLRDLLYNRLVTFNMCLLKGYKSCQSDSYTTAKVATTRRTMSASAVAPPAVASSLLPMIEELVQSGMNVEHCNKLLNIELRRMQLGYENEELAIYTKKTRDELVLRLEKLQMVERIIEKTVQLTDDVLQFMDKVEPLLSDGLPERSAADFVQDHRIKFIIQMVQHLPTLFMDDAPPPLLLPDCTTEKSDAVHSTTDKSDVIQEDAPLSIATFLAESNVVDNENGDIANAVDRIAERMYRCFS